MEHPVNPTDDAAADELLPSWDVEPPPAPPTAIPMAEPVVGDVPEAVPVAEVAEAAPVAEAAEAPPAAPAAIPCPVCQSPHVGKNPYCSDCGYYFSPEELSAAASGSAAPRRRAGRPPARPLRGRGQGERTAGRAALPRP